MSNFPNFLIVGAAKSGTTTLYQHLKQHPQIFMPDRKELNFWYTHGREDWAILKRFPDLPTTLEDYLSYFKTDLEVSGEASPGYLVNYEEVIENLKKLHPNYREVKIIIVLREPISKIWSHYKMVRRGKMDPDNLSLKESLYQEKNRVKDASYLLDLLPIHSTDYYKQVKAYLDNFNEVKVLLFDELNAKEQLVMDSVTDFLAVDKMELPNVGYKYNAAPARAPQQGWVKLLKKMGVNKMIPSKLKKKTHAVLTKEEKMDKDSEKILKAYYRDDVTKLQDLLGVDLSHWLKKY